MERSYKYYLKAYVGGGINLRNLAEIEGFEPVTGNVRKPLEKWAWFMRSQPKLD